MVLVPSDFAWCFGVKTVSVLGIIPSFYFVVYIIPRNRTMSIPVDNKAKRIDPKRREETIFCWVVRAPMRGPVFDVILAREWRYVTRTAIDLAKVEP
jgi:hypothetical protein